MNAQSLRNNKDRNKFDEFFTEIADYDITAVSETWLSANDNENDFKIPGFHKPFWKDRIDRVGGGVALFIKDSYHCKQRHDLNVNELEAVWCEVRVNNIKSLFCSIYREPRSKAKTWELFEESLEQAKLTGIHRIFVLGDLNDDYQKTQSKLRKICDEYHLTQVIKEKTHENALIDVIMTTSPDTVKDTGTLAPVLSKHRPVFAECNFNASRGTTYKRKVYNYKNADWAGLRRDLQEKNWDPIFRLANVHEMTEEWTTQFIDMMEKHIPTRNVTIRSAEAPWMTADIKKMMNKRNSLYRKSKTKPHLWDNFKAMRNKIIEKIKEAKDKHTRAIEDKINKSSTTNDKTWWNLVKQVMNTSKATSTSCPPLIIDDTVITEDTEKANAMNNYFAEQSTIDTSNLEIPNKEIPQDATLETISISALTVQSILQNLKINSACGPDNISPRVLKRTADVICGPLAKLFNFSLQTEQYPPKWKEANVTPIFKKGDSSIVKN